MTATTHKPYCNRAFTLIEVALVAIILAILVAVLLTGLVLKGRSSRLAACQNNLKQVSLAHHLWVDDHAENFLPGEISTNRGGSLEYLQRAELWRHFKLFTNELARPEVLVCPADGRKPAKSFSVLTKSNLSYFVNGSAGPIFGRSGPPDRPIDSLSIPVMLGDRDVTNISGPPSQILSATHRNQIGWNAGMHTSGRKDSKASLGNIAFTDGSVKNLTTAELREAFRYDPSTNLVLP